MLNFICHFILSVGFLSFGLNFQSLKPCGTGGRTGAHSQLPSHPAGQGGALRLAAQFRHATLLIERAARAHLSADLLTAREAAALAAATVGIAVTEILQARVEADDGGGLLVGRAGAGFGARRELAGAWRRAAALAALGDETGFGEADLIRPAAHAVTDVGGGWRLRQTRAGLVGSERVTITTTSEPGSWARFERRS